MKTFDGGVNKREKKQELEQKTKSTFTKLFDNKLDNNIILRFFVKGVGGILLLGVIIGCSSSFLTQVLQNNEKVNIQQSTTNKLYIGTNEEYVNSVLGYPFLKNINEKTNMTDCFYRIDGAIVRLFFENNSAKGIFITITDKNAKGVFTFDNYSWVTDNKKLGMYTYEDIDWDNDGNYFQYTNGLGTVFYIEEYDFASSGGYYYHYFATFPYGTFIVPKEINKNEKDHLNWEGGQFGGYFPNTIGITDMDFREKICAMILDVRRFDYKSMNIYDEQEWNYYDNLPKEGDDIDEGVDLAEDDDAYVYKPTYFEECLQKYLDEVYDKNNNDEDYYDEINEDDTTNEEDVVNENDITNEDNITNEYD